MSLPRVLSDQPLPPEWLAALDGRVALATGIAEREPSAEGLLASVDLRVDEHLLSRLPQLRVVSVVGVGVDSVDLAACHARGIPVGHTPGVLTDATADLTMALLLAATRNLDAAARDAREGRWMGWSLTRWLGLELREATLGIVGMGRIGSAVASRARAFGMQIVYASPSEKPDIDASGLGRRVALDELFRVADVVTLHCPLDEHTRGLVDSRRLRAMQPHALLVNTARGGLVETAALQRALDERWIAGAALDVTEPEPLPADHPLYETRGCLIVPHIGSATARTRRAMVELACRNLLAGLAGDPLPHAYPRGGTTRP
jgi:lactate dehydrogenase-like 2-hydroxyacid dehydrogenase